MKSPSPGPEELWRPLLLQFANILEHSSGIPRGARKPKPLRPPRLTGLPPVEALHAYNLPLRFRGLWPRPHLGLPRSLLRHPWPSGVWEALYATLLRLVHEKDTAWADRFEDALWSQVFGPLRSRRTVSAAGLIRGLRSLKVPKRDPGRPRGSRRAHDIEHAACFADILARLLRRAYKRRPAALGGPQYVRPPVQMLADLWTWWQGFQQLSPMPPAERLTRAMADVNSVAPAPWACALNLTAALFQWDPRELRRAIASYKRAVDGLGGGTFYRFLLGEHLKQSPLPLGPPRRPTRA